MFILDPQTIRGFRLRYNLTQEELAQALGVDRNTVSRWELGHLPDAAKMLELALAGLELKLTLDRPEVKRLIDEIKAHSAKGGNEEYERLRVKHSKKVRST